jgi:hypothetical protein
MEFILAVSMSCMLLRVVEEVVNVYETEMATQWHGIIETGTDLRQKTRTEIMR